MLGAVAAAPVRRFVQERPRAPARKPLFPARGARSRLQAVPGGAICGSMIVLGIETSCDETAVAVVEAGPQPQIRANLIRSQLPEHMPYGGVVPEIPARAHLDHIEALVEGALDI